MENKTKKVRDWRCYYPDSPISTFKTLPNSNFSFGEVEGFDAHCFFLSLMVFFFLFSIFIVITIVIISIHFFVYLFIPLSPSSELSLLLQSIYIFFVYLFLLFFPIECQATCFKKSSYIFSKSGRHWRQNWFVCDKQGGYLVSIETQEEWQFISHEIQKRGTSNTSAWHIGLEKNRGVWTWKSGEKLNISKWRDSQPDGNNYYVEISKNRGLFNRVRWYDKNAFICEMPGGKITFQPWSILCAEILAVLHLCQEKFLLLLKSKNVVHIICSAHLTCTCERRMNF